MASPFETKYTDEQRDALAHTYEDRRIRPARLVVQLAADGQLEWKGQKLEPFHTTENTVRSLADQLRKSRAGTRSSDLATIPHKDAIEQLRRRLVAAADHILAAEERALKTDPRKTEPERLRQIVRVVREAAALPGPNDPRPTAPGRMKDGEQSGSPTRAGTALAGKLMAAHRGTTPAHATPRDTDALGDRDAHTQPHADNQPTNTDTQLANNPGALVRARLGLV